MSSTLLSIEKKIALAASVYDVNYPETNDPPPRIHHSHDSFLEQTIDEHNPAAHPPAHPPVHSNKRRSHGRMSIYQHSKLKGVQLDIKNGRKQRPPKGPTSVVDQGIVERYQILQESSLEFMHLIETEARKLLDVQKRVMEESLHLEHIRKEFGGYTTSTSVLNSGERGTQVEIAKEKAFFEQHIQNLESELVASNTMVSKEVIFQNKITLLINEQRRLIGGKKKSLIQLNGEINKCRKEIQQFRLEILSTKKQCIKEKHNIEKLKKNEQRMMMHMSKEIEKVAMQKKRAAVQFKINMTSFKQEVERQRRAVTMERLKTMPKRPSTSQSRKKPRTSLRARVGATDKRSHRKNARPRTAGGQLVSKQPRFANKADVMKGSRKQKRRPSTAENLGASSLFQATTKVDSKADSKAESKQTIAGTEQQADDEAGDESKTKKPRSPSRRSPPPKVYASLKPNWDHEPDAKHDVTKHPKLWMPGRPQERNDPSADHSHSSKNIPSPLGRRGSLVGRNPSRFGATSKISGRLELLLSTLPQMENKKIKMQERGAAMNWQLARKQISAQDMEQSIEELEKLFKKIQDKTGIATIEEFANVFMTSEARQFDIVKQVEEFENTLSTIESHNHSMIKEIELEKNKLNLMKENSLFTKIQNEINAVKTSEKNYRKQLSQTKNHIKGCIKSVSVLLNVINTKDVQHLTGNDGQYIEELLMSSTNSISSDNNSNNKSLSRQSSNRLSRQSSNRLSRQSSNRSMTEFVSTNGGVVTESLLPQCLGSIEERILQLLQMNQVKQEHEASGRSRSATPYQRPASRATTSFGETSLQVNQSRMVGGNLPVVEQVRKKFNHLPQWQQNMAVDMRDNLSGTTKQESSDEDKDEDEDAVLDMQQDKEARKQERKKKQQKDLVPTTYLSVLLPRDEELETSSDEDSDSELDDALPYRNKQIARPVSRAEMRNRALLVVQRRQEIEKFLGTNSAQQREARRFKMDHLDEHPDAEIKKNYKINPSKKRMKTRENQAKAQLLEKAEKEKKRELATNNQELEAEIKRMSNV